MSTVDTLKKIYLFSDLSAAELSDIAKLAEEKTYNAGQDIFVEGQQAESMYVIRMGSIRIYSTSKSGDDIKLTSLQTGTHFGEMPFIDNEKRSATAQAVETTTALEIKYNALRGLIEKNPTLSGKIYFAMAKFLCGRLRATTGDLSQSRELKMKHF